MFAHGYPWLALEAGRGRHRGGQAQEQGRHGGLPLRLRYIGFVTPLPCLQAPFGLQNGLAGQKGNNLLTRKNGNIIQLAACCQVNLKTNDSLQIETPGGGFGLAPKC